MAIRYIALGPLFSGEGSRAFLGLRVVDDDAGPCALVWVPEHVTCEPDQVERLRRETARAAQLAHPNILRVFGLTELDEGLARVVEYADGESLRRVLEVARRLPSGLAARVAVDAALGVQYAHLGGNSDGAPLVHGDLRPETLLVSYSGITKVTGYGALTVAPRETGGKRVMGRRLHSAPEQILGGRFAVTPQTDVYLLGVVLYEALTGEIPFQGEEDFDGAVLAKPPPLLESELVPHAFRPVLAKAMAKKGSHRFVTVQAFREAVEEAAGRIPERFDLGAFLECSFAEDNACRARQRVLEEGLRDWRERRARPALTPIPLAGPVPDAASPVPVPATPVVPVPPAPPPSTSSSAVPPAVAPAPSASVPPAPARLTSAPPASVPPAAAPPAPPASASPVPVAAEAPGEAAPIQVGPPGESLAAVSGPATAEVTSGAGQVGDASARPATRGRSFWRAVAIPVAAAGVVGAFWMGRQSGAPAPSPAASPAAAPAAVPAAARAVPPAAAPAPVPFPALGPIPTFREEGGRWPRERSAEVGPAPRVNGTLEVESTPPLSLSIDGKSRGRTPVQAELPTGSHRLTFSDPEQGIRVVRAVQVKRGQNRFALTVGRGSVTVSGPTGCEVSIDNRFAGKLPLAGPVPLFEGGHSIRVSLGAAHWQQAFSVADGEVVTVDVKFQETQRK